MSRTDIVSHGHDFRYPHRAPRIRLPDSTNCSFLISAKCVPYLSILHVANAFFNRNSRPPVEFGYTVLCITSLRGVMWSTNAVRKVCVMHSIHPVAPQTNDSTGMVSLRMASPPNNRPELNFVVTQRVTSYISDRLRDSRSSTLFRVTTYSSDPRMPRLQATSCIFENQKLLRHLTRVCDTGQLTLSRLP